MSLTLLGALRSLDESRHRAELYRAWGTGLAAGLTPKVVLEQMGPIAFPAVEEARRYLVVGTGQEKSVATLVKARPALFAPFEGAVLAAGDEGGSLGQSVRLLTEYFAGDYKRRLKARDLLMYPIFLALAASFAIPFVALHKSPPRTYATAIAILIGAFLLLGGPLISILAAIIMNTRALTRARFARILATTLESGIHPGRAVRLAAEACGNPGIRDRVKKRNDRELNTTPMAKLFDGCEDVPAGLLGQMMVADATSDYRGTIGSYARSLDELQK